MLQPPLAICPNCTAEASQWSEITPRNGFELGFLCGIQCRIMTVNNNTVTTEQWRRAREAAFHAAMSEMPAQPPPPEREAAGGGGRAQQTIACCATPTHLRKAMAKESRKRKLVEVVVPVGPPVRVRGNISGIAGDTGNAASSGDPKPDEGEGTDGTKNFAKAVSVTIPGVACAQLDGHGTGGDTQLAHHTDRAGHTHDHDVPVQVPASSTSMYPPTANCGPHKAKTIATNKICSKAQLLASPPPSHLLQHRPESDTSTRGFVDLGRGPAPTGSVLEAVRRRLTPPKPKR